MMNADPTRTDVFVIDDEQQLRRMLRLILEDAGYSVREAETGHAGLAELARKQADIVILDLGLPDQSGLSVLRQLREWNASPVLILSVADAEADKIAGLDAGADDYLAKPFAGGELLARLRALHRRIKPAVASSTFHFDALEVDLAKRRVTKAGKPVKLTAMEYALLQLLITHRDRVLTHRQILSTLWGPKSEQQTHYLRTYMMRLRRKLEDDLDAPKLIQTESGVGYRFVSEPQPVS